MKALRIVSILAIACMVAACAGQAIKSPTEMTPKERAAMVLNLYNSAYANYTVQYAATARPFSKEMADYFRGYKAVMESAWPMISTYAAIAQTGGTPTVEQEQAIIALIYQFQTIAMKEVDK